MGYKSTGGFMFIKQPIAIVLGVLVIFTICFAGKVPVAQAASTNAVLTDEQISGLWYMDVKLEDGGGGVLTFYFEVENGKLTGLYNGNLGEDVPVEGYVKGNIIRWEFVADKSQIVYKGDILENGTISGWVEYECCGPGVFTASKQK